MSLYRTAARSRACWIRRISRSMSNTGLADRFSPGDYSDFKDFQDYGVMFPAHIVQKLDGRPIAELTVTEALANPYMVFPPPKELAQPPRKLTARRAGGLRGKTGEHKFAAVALRWSHEGIPSICGDLCGARRGFSASTAGVRAASDVAYGITSATAFSLPHYIAEEKGYYTKAGLAVTTYVTGSAAGVFAAACRRLAEYRPGCD